MLRAANQFVKTLDIAPKMLFRGRNTEKCEVNGMLRREGATKTFEPGMRCMLVVLIGAILVAIVFTFSGGINGNDFWWHIKIGEWIMEHGEVPHSDIFSWYRWVEHIPWTAHEWLSDVLFYQVYIMLGQGGVFLFSITAALLLTILLLRDAWKHVKRNVLIGGIYFALMAVTTSIFFYGRPQVFSYFLVYGQLKILYKFRADPKSRRIFLLPILACLWSNLHGGSSCLSYSLCVIFLISGTMNIQLGTIHSVRMERKSLVVLSLVTVCTVGAILVNPVGMQVLLYPFKNMGDQLQMTLISEWRSPDAKVMGELILFFLPGVLMLFGLVTCRDSIELVDLTVMGLFCFLFFRSIRFAMLCYIVAVFCAMPYMPTCKVKHIPWRKEKLAIVSSLVLLTIPLSIGIKELWETWNQGRLIEVVLSQEAVEAVKSQKPQKLFNDYNLGEALIYNDIPVFFDARADLYVDNGILADGASLMFLEQVNGGQNGAYVDVDKWVEKYGFDGILILKGRPLFTYLISKQKQYALIYQDQQVAYFKVL